MARKKIKAKDLKKQRWAAIIAGVLAVGMLASLGGVYLAQSMGNSTPSLPGQANDPQPEDYLAYYKAEVERLETYLQEHEPTVPVLMELAENYRYLTFIQQVFFDDDDETLQDYQIKLASVYQSLIDLEPDKPEYRLELIYLYLESGGDLQPAYDQVTLLRQQLRENPDPLVHLSLVGILNSAGEKELLEDDLDWLYGYLDEKVTSDTASNEERFYYAVLLGEYLDDQATAETVLLDIMEQENEESQIYQEAMNYLNYLSGDSASIESGE
ncbi:MAG: hypothetical protein SCJ97_09205 [Bacillota bacterium]|nr:hypothetical protein [Bacillota bacterium]